MNKQSLFFTVLVAIIATVLMLMAIQLLAKRQKIQSITEQKVILSYSVWFLSLLIPFFLYLKVALELLENTIEILINPKSPENAFFGTIQRIAIYIGFVFVFTFLTNFISRFLLKLTTGNKIESIEIENDNVGYFIIKGFLMVFLVFSILTIFEHFLNWFTPIIETPFYH